MANITLIMVGISGIPTVPGAHPAAVTSIAFAGRGTMENGFGFAVRAGHAWLGGEALIGRIARGLDDVVTSNALRPAPCCPNVG
jgi:hypothetical protein